MFKSRRKKVTAFALSAFMAVGIFGTTIVSAHPNDNPPPQYFDEPGPPPPPLHHSHRHWVDGHWYHNQWIDGHWEDDRR
ncbi:hypothetical protein [Pectinatus haikarae]|uniref:Lipoprotein n=1 Tax=Pectinatus haikarae TaxID=349096 RepID=A0ABT9Y960_9FIRM|nr:hypothetical protein [Pectinatus haikarae]MDQ0204363.1 hypothetical protein [Pectinatus haikarae]